MNKKETNITVLLVIGGLVILAIGVGVGIFYQSERPEIKQAIKMGPTVKMLTSKAVQAIPVYGQIEKINGTNITISYAGDQITVGVKEGVQVFSSVAQKDPKTGNLITGAPQPVKFSDLKVGDGVSITLKILENGQVEGDSVFIFASMPTVK